MGKRSRMDAQRDGVGAKSRLKKGMKAVCLILCVIFLIGTCVGCTSYASVDDVSEMQGRLDGALQELEEIRAEYESTKEELEASNQAAKEAEEAAKQEIEHLKDNYGVAQEEIDDLKEKIEDLKNDLLGDGTEKIKIYIDQGHNPTSYHNSGSMGNGLYEQDLTFEIGKLLATLLREDGRFEVRLSRLTKKTVLGTDNDSSLDARIEGAKEFGADYFISLHTNSYADASVGGIEVYTVEDDRVSCEFGSSLLQGLVAATNLRSRGMKLNSELRVLKNATMPATLIEMGFISNMEDAALLSESPELFAKGIYNGILSYFELEANDSPSDE